MIEVNGKKLTIQAAMTFVQNRLDLGTDDIYGTSSDETSGLFKTLERLCTMFHLEPVKGLTMLKMPKKMRVSTLDRVELVNMYIEKANRG